MYIIDFFERNIRKANVPVIIYLILNVWLIQFVVCAVFRLPGWKGALISLLLYFASMSIALSPVGEWILRIQQKCKSIERIDQKEYLEPLFREVYERAKAKDPSIPDDVWLFINEDPSINAFAIGRKTICLTKGMLNMPASHIKAVLGHEFGHLSHKDTDMLVLINVGNFFVLFIEWATLLLIYSVYALFSLFALVGGIVSASGACTFFMLKLNGFLKNAASAIVSGIIWVWMKIGLLLVMKSSRSVEYEADGFSYMLGYGNELCAMLDMPCKPDAKGLFACLSSSHPPDDARIENLQKLGAAYYKGKKTAS